MMMAMLIAGIACLLAGLLAIGFGIPVNEFSFGNTLILAGAIAVCAGLIILSMWAAVRELKNMAAWVGSGAALDRTSDATKPAVLPAPAAADDRSAGGLGEGAEASAYPSAPATVPWQADAAARARNDTVKSQESQPAAKPRRNLMFSSSSRRERERAQAQAVDSSAGEPQSTTSGTSPPQESTEAPPPVFGDTWPRSERSRTADSLQRRAARLQTTSIDPAAARQAPAAPAEEQAAAVTVLKSGVVDGMAYSLYSDGSIEAQMPEGMMRFASIDELRAHLDHRP
jgi:hypothetical protein